jgi:hypothetical protein
MQDTNLVKFSLAIGARYERFSFKDIVLLLDKFGLFDRTGIEKS